MPISIHPQPFDIPCARMPDKMFSCQACYVALLIIFQSILHLTTLAVIRHAVISILIAMLHFCCLLHWCCLC